MLPHSDICINIHILHVRTSAHRHYTLGRWAESGRSNDAVYLYMTDTMEVKAPADCQVIKSN